MSDRIGANRAYVRIPFTQIKLVWLGLFHGIADGIKMLVKEDFKPRTYDWYAYAVAPWVVFTPVLLVFGVIPFGGLLDPGRLFPSLADWFGGRTYPMQIAQLDAGLLIVFAFSGMTIIGAMLAGWSSANKFSLLGGLRAGSQMISYELVMGLTVLGPDPDLRHRRPRLDGAPAVGRGARLPAGLGRGLPALRGGAVPDRGHRREQAHPLRPARGRVGAHRRLLHRIQRDEDGPVHVRRVHRDRDRRRAVHHAVPRRLQPALHERRRLHAARRHHARDEPRRGGRDAAAWCSWSR